MVFQVATTVKRHVALGAAIWQEVEVFKNMADCISASLVGLGAALTQAAVGLVQIGALNML